MCKFQTQQALPVIAPTKLGASCFPADGRQSASSDQRRQTLLAQIPSSKSLQIFSSAMETARQGFVQNKQKLSAQKTRKWKIKQSLHLAGFSST